MIEGGFVSQLNLFEEPERQRPEPVVNGVPPGAVIIGAGIRKTQEYAEYIKSAQWRNTRQQLFKMRGQKCERCDATTNLEIHHKTYERFKRELPSDLLILCKLHHERADREREAELEQAFQSLREERRYESARDSYIEKVYGGYVAGWMYQEFEEWRQRKEDRGEWNASDYYS